MSGHIQQPKPQARYAAAGELLATVSRIVFAGDDGETAIFKTVAGDTVVCEGGAGSIVEGGTYRLLGSYREDPKFGRQFKAQAFLQDAGHDKTGVVKYLVTHCKGIGQRIAERLWDAFGSAAVRTVREFPEQVTFKGFLNEQDATAASEQLERLAAYEGTTIDLHSLFHGRGLGSTCISACLDAWGIAAAEKVRRNPFSLLIRKMPRAGFATTDRLYLDLGGRPDALKRQALAGWHALREGSDGSTWHPYSAFAAGIVKQVGASQADLPRACSLAQRARLITDSLTCGVAGWVADPKQAANERGLAAAIKRLFDRGQGGWIVPEASAVSAHQLAAFKPVSESPFILITGVPGSGKTHLAAAAVRAVVCKHGLNAVAVCAPTGKAAVRITQALLKNGINIEATTIHRLLGVQRNGRDGEGWSFNFDADHPLPWRFVVVDEFSMLDTDLAFALFSALAPGSSVLAVGDPNQLPPVGHGAVLRDVIAAGLPRAHLTEIQRNNGGVTEACRAIVEGRRVEFCEKLDLPNGANCKWVECETDEDQLAALRVHVDALRKRPNFNLFDDLQVLTPRNDESRVARKQLNAYLQQLINPELPTDPKGKAEGYRLRDKVICLSNTQTDLVRMVAGSPHWTTDSWVKVQGTLEQPGLTFVANGDMGRIVAVHDRRAEVIVRFMFPTRYVKWRLTGKKKEDAARLGGGKEDLALGYAITFHKSQGSEWPWVIGMVDANADRVASKELAYTGLSRLITANVWIGRRATFDRQVRRAELPGRKTFLKELLLESCGDGKVDTFGTGAREAEGASGREGEDGD